MSKDLGSFAKFKKWLKKEFNWRNFSIVHNNHSLFVQSEWTKGYISAYYVIYRLIVALILIGWVILDLIVEENNWHSTTPYFWILFATNWGLSILSISAFVSAINVIRFYARQREKILGYDISPPHTRTDCMLSFQWLLHITGANLAILVSVAYWGFVFVFEGPAYLKSNLSIAKHTINSIYVLIDMFIISTPVRLLHVVYPFIVGVLYTIFHVVYFVSGGDGQLGENRIYELMDWNKDPLSSSLTCLFAFAVIILSQLVLYLVYKIRESIGKERRTEDEERIVDDLSMDEDGNDNDVLESDTRNLPMNYQAIN